MPSYIVSSEGPIKVREVNRPDLPGLPDWEVGGGPIIPEGSWKDYLRDQLEGLRDKLEGVERPELPPREDWPELPPWLRPGVSLPIPPSIEHPMVPVDPEMPDPPDLWPPLPRPPFELPDVSGKTLCLVTVHVSRHVHFVRWMVIDHAEAKSKIQKAIQWVKDHLPAGGIIGRPPPSQGRP